MIKLIFLVVIGIVIFAFVGQPLSVYTTWFSEGLSNFIGATGLIFSVLGALTINLFDYAFIRSILIAGSFVFAVDYIIKLITGHHLEEDEEEIIEDEKYNTDMANLQRYQQLQVVGQKTYENNPKLYKQLEKEIKRNNYVLNQQKQIINRNIKEGKYKTKKIIRYKIKKGARKK